MKSKNPFKPIPSSKEELINYEEMTVHEERIEQAKRRDEEFKPSLKEDKKTNPDLKPYNVDLDPKDVLVHQENWSRILGGLYLDIFNADKSKVDIADSIKKIMNRNGIEVNTDEVDNLISTTQDRMLKIFLAKNICYALGMSSEWKDEILSRELDLVYPERPLLGTPKSKVKE